MIDILEILDQLRGIRIFPKRAEERINEGDLVYWDDGAGVVTTGKPPNVHKQARDDDYCELCRPPGPDAGQRAFLDWYFGEVEPPEGLDGDLRCLKIPRGMRDLRLNRYFKKGEQVFFRPSNSGFYGADDRGPGDRFIGFVEKTTCAHGHGITGVYLSFKNGNNEDVGEFYVPSRDWSAGPGMP